jgi:transcriptional regulator GlxA family with amidase domain
MILFPGLQALDVYGPLAILKTLAFSNDKLNLSLIASTLKPVTTQPEIVGVGSNFGSSIKPTHTFKHPPKDLDVLIVPGGGGLPKTLANDDLVEYVKKEYPKLKYIISICSGSTFLARAGILDGKHATTNKRAWAWAVPQGPKVIWEPVARWTVDGNIWTTSGVSAGMDGVYAYVAHLYGEAVSLDIANGLEYERHTNASWDPFGKIWGVPGA